MEWRMTWPFGERALTGVDPYIADRMMRSGKPANRRVSEEEALRHSAVWACLRLRADLVSTMPLDVYRRVGNVAVEVPTPPVLVVPGGSANRLIPWLEASQRDLDTYGNTFGIITARDGNQLPARIELVDASCVTVRIKDGVVTYRIGSTEYGAGDIWHERQFVVSGVPVGLSPIAHAAMSINGYLSAQQFASDWFGNSGVPAAHLKNTSKKLETPEAFATKERFKASIRNGDIFVTGNDWEYQMLSAKASESQFLEERRFGIGDVCRFFGVPGDMIDAETSSGSITYANITQRNLQLLIMNLNPSLRRREDAFSAGLVANPRFVKFNRGALLEMDLKSRYESYKVGVDSRILAPSEARELENRPPFTPEQVAEFTALFPSKAPTPMTGAPS